MLFRLNAQTSGFRKEFQEAQRDLQSMGEAIRDLGKIQADISAYQKQQQAIDATSAKLNNLKGQQQLLQQEVQQTKSAGESTAALEREQLKLTQRIDDTEAALTRQNQKLSETGQRLQNAGVDTANLAQEDAQLTATIQSLTAEQQEADQALQDLADAQEEFGDTGAAAWEAVASAIAAAGIAAALQELYEAYAECIAITGEFEDSMANVGALSGATAQEMGELTALAKELGATTKFTAKESADAMGYMAMAGWDAQQMISGLPGVIQLAAASGEDLATVSDIVTDSLTAFGLTAADSSHYADVLAAAATNANTNVSIMGETFKYAAPMAGALGYAAEDVSVAVGMMANAGIKGSQAGTSLNNIFTRLVKPTKESADAMNALGLSLLDDTGRMYTFMELMEIMRDRFAGLTETEKAFYAAELAGQRGMAGLLSVVNASESDFAKLSAAINDCDGAARRMAAIKLDTMNGQLTLMNSAAEALKTTVGEQFTPILKDVYGAGAEVMTEINAFLQANPQLIKGFTALAAGIAVTTAGITGFTAAAKIIPPVLTAIKAAMALAGGLPAIAIGVTAAIATTTAAMFLFRDEADGTTYTARQQRAELKRLEAEYQDACSTFGESSEEANTLRYRMMSLNDTIEAGAPSIKAMKQEHNDLIASLKDSRAAYQGSIDQINAEKLDAAALSAELHRLAEAYTGSAGEAELMGRLIQELNGRYEDLNLTLDDVTDGTDSWSESLDAYIREAAEAQERTINLNRAVELLTQKRQLEVDLQNYQEELEAAAEAAESFKNRTFNTGSDWSGAMDYLAAAVQMADAKQKIEDTKAALKDVEDQYTSVTGKLGVYADALNDAASADQNFQNVLNVLSGRLEGLQEEYLELYETASKSVEGQYSLWDEAAEVIPKSVADMTKAMQSQIDYWKEYRENLDYLREMSSSVEGLDSVVSNFADGTPEHAAAIAGLATAFRNGDDGADDMIAAFQNLQTEQEAVKESMALTAGSFGTEMNKMVNSVEDAVQKMNKDNLAAASAQATMQAFVNKISEYTGPVQSAANRVAMAAVNELNRSLNALGTRVTLNGTSVSVRTVGTSIGDLRKQEYSGYAIGTNYAAKGVGLVGELGPELVYFNGGETVITASETREILREMSFLRELLPGYAAGTANLGGIRTAVIPVPVAPAPINAQFDAYSFAPDRGDDANGGAFTFSPVYHITVNGNGANDSNLEAVLQKHDEDLQEQMDQWWREKQIDSVRRGFR